ncbi:hypothetical protein WI665_14390 [Vibrio cholerae]
MSAFCHAISFIISTAKNRISCCGPMPAILRVNMALWALRMAWHRTGRAKMNAGAVRRRGTITVGDDQRVARPATPVSLSHPSTNLRDAAVFTQRPLPEADTVELRSPRPALLLQASTTIGLISTPTKTIPARSLPRSCRPSSRSSAGITELCHDTSKKR